MNISAADVTVVIPNWNGLAWLPACLDALEHQALKPAAVIIVDNGSTDGSCEWIQAHYPSIELIRMDKNHGFAAAVNAGIRHARTTLIALLNNDTMIERQWLQMLASALISADERTGAVCGKMLRLDDPLKIENAGDILTWQGAAEKRGNGEPAHAFSEAGEVFSVCAGGALYRKSFFETVGLFDEHFFAYLEDIDLGLRGRLMGYRFLYCPQAIMKHQGHGSGLPSSRYVRLSTTNRLRVFLKNIPGPLLARHMASLLYGQWYFMIAQRRPIAFLAGCLDTLRAWPQLRLQRSQIRLKTVLNDSAIDALLEKKMRQPGLAKAALNLLMGRNKPS